MKHTDRIKVHEDLMLSLTDYIPLDRNNEDLIKVVDNGYFYFKRKRTYYKIIQNEFDEIKSIKYAYDTTSLLPKVFGEFKKEDDTVFYYNFRKDKLFKI
jgi:hypothetical protein